MQGYYDYGPRTVLPRPLGLIGFMGAGAAQVGHTLAATLGLPLHQLDRQIEHDAGMSLSALQLEQGIATRRAREHTALQKALRETPFGVVVLGDGALLERRSQQLIADALQLVYLRRPLPVLRQAIERELQQAPGRYPEFVLAAQAPSEADLNALLSERQPGYALSDYTFDAGHLHPQRVCDALIQALSLLPKA